MTPKKNFRDYIHTATDAVKGFFSSVGAKIKHTLSNADKNVKKNVSTTSKRIQQTKQKPVVSNKTSYTSKPAKPNTFGKRKITAKPTEETVIFTDDSTKRFIASTPDLDETQPLPVTDSKQKSFRKTWFKPRDKKPNFVLGVILTTVKILFVAIFVFVAIGFGTIMGVANAYLESTPELDTQKIETQKLSSYILDQEGSTIATYSGAENRDMATIEEIPENLQNAVISVEDLRFYDHNGVDFRRLIGAFVSNLSSSKVEGGSTITQQLVKNKLLTNEVSYKRKLQEAYLAMALEKKYDKKEILGAYLNSIPLGGKVYGVKTAAKDYFGKDLSKLTLKEMICIAAITQNPTKYNPRTVTYNPDKIDNLVGKKGLLNRMNIIAERMSWNGMITQEEYQSVYTPYDVYSAPGYIDTWKEEMNILEESPANELYDMPHFTEYVIYQVQTFLLRKQGLEDNEINRQKVDQEMRAGGYRIYSTVDVDMQNTVQQTLSEYPDYPTFDSIVKKDADGNVIETKEPQASAVIEDNEKGWLLAIVGSRDEPEVRRSLNRAWQGTMPVGSAIKPLAIYGTAFENGYGAVSPVANIPVPITNWDSETGYPVSSQGTPGPASLRQAIVGSWNISAARTLMDYVGLNAAEAQLLKLGVSPNSIDKTGVGLALGASPITPIEMTGAYSTIARGGEYKEPISFTKVVDSQGNIIIDAEAERIVHEGFKPSTAWMLTDIMEDGVDHGTGTQAKIEGMTVAGKTGTNTKDRGVTFAGFTPYYTASLWVGHDENLSLPRGYGSNSLAANLWSDFMSKIHTDKGKTDQPIQKITAEQAGLVEATVCQYSGLLSNGSCPTFTDYIAATDVPTEQCDVCVSAPICALSNQRFVEGRCPPEQYAVRSARNFPEGSPYRSWGGGSGGTAADGTPLPPSDPYTDCTYPHGSLEAPPAPAPVPTPAPAPTVAPAT
ncbi:MAG: transglycosylase domain-containing protein [Christensenellaceae bacterium]